MEFCALVTAMKWRKDNKSNLYVYSDSQTARAWALSRNVNTSLPKNEQTVVMWKFIENCLLWLVNNTKVDNMPMSKWDTANWGENPADFGYKNKLVVDNSIPVNTPAYSKESYVSKDELRKWILNEEIQPLVDITTMARLKRDFKL